MKTWKIALGSLVVGAVLSLVPIVAYASCAPEIWVQDDPDCHISHRYTLIGQNCSEEPCVCAYRKTSSTHIEDGPCE